MFDNFGQANVSKSDLHNIDMSGITDADIFIFTWTVYSVAGEIIDLFGIMTNVINIICFAKQGFTDSINVSLMGLSISDLGSLTTSVILNIGYTPAVSASDMPFDMMEVNYLIFAMPHLTFARISSWITAIITLERCLCVIAPLKVKSIITTKRVAGVIISIFIVSFCSLAPIYTVNELGIKFSPLRNKTIFGLVYNIDRANVDKISFIFNNFAMSFLAFTVIVISTTILVVKLESTNKWRSETADKSQAELVGNRNKKIVKMVIMISSLFIVCFIPLSIGMLALAFVPELSFNGRYIKVGMLLGGIGFVLESINSSCNIFIYYHMSSKYRIVCGEILHKVHCDSH